MHSSHLVSDVERVCDYLVVLVASRVQVASDVTRLLATHHWISGPHAVRAALPPGLHVVCESDSALLVMSERPAHHPAWDIRPVTLEDLVLGYLSAPATPELEVLR